MNEAQEQLDEHNRSYWDELCGTSLARSLGIEAIDKQSLAKFDAAYLDVYPYLRHYVERERVDGRAVLEIGLGFGTLGQLLVEQGAEYFGVDIAMNPVELMRERLRMSSFGDPERVVRASALDLPCPDGSFDAVYSIGCLHHTGDLPKAVSEVHRVLRPGGTAVVMLYNRHSLRQFLLRGALAPRRQRSHEESATERLRGAYDRNSDGEAAPHTDFVSRSEAHELFGAFAHIEIDVRNFDNLTLNLRRRTPLLARVLRRDALGLSRRIFLGNLARVVGLDLYITATR